MKDGWSKLVVEGVKERNIAVEVEKTQVSPSNMMKEKLQNSM